MDKSVDWTKLTVRQENEKILILQQYWKLHKLSDGDLKECFKKILSIYKGQVPKEREPASPSIGRTVKSVTPSTPRSACTSDSSRLRPVRV